MAQFGVKKVEEDETIVTSSYSSLVHTSRIKSGLSKQRKAGWAWEKSWKLYFIYFFLPLMNIKKCNEGPYWYLMKT